MDRSEHIQSTKSKTSLPFDNTPSISIYRNYNSSPECLWRAWSGPELIKQCSKILRMELVLHLLMKEFQSQNTRRALMADHHHLTNYKS